MVRKGQRAWTTLKATAAEQRELWRDVGEALLVGRRLHPSNQAFGLWACNEGFGMHPTQRSNAMWLAENWSVLRSSQDGLTHPDAIRQHHRDIKLVPAPNNDLVIDSPVRVVAGIEVVAKVAKTVNKLAAMAERGEGQEAQLVGAIGQPAGGQGRLLQQTCQGGSMTPSPPVPPVAPSVSATRTTARVTLRASI